MIELVDTSATLDRGNGFGPLVGILAERSAARRMAGILGSDGVSVISCAERAAA